LAARARLICAFGGFVDDQAGFERLRLCLGARPANFATHSTSRNIDRLLSSLRILSLGSAGVA